MADDQEKIRITSADLRDPKVVEIVAQERALRRPQAGLAMAPPTPWYLSSIFYTAIAGAVGAAAGWGLIEPFYKDNDEVSAAQFLLLPVVAGAIGLFIGAVEGLMSRNLGKGAIGAALGFVIGFVCGFPVTFLANFVFGASMLMVRSYVHVDATQRITGIEPFGLFLMVGARSLGWALAGTTVALGQGIAMRSRKLMINGVLGGVTGGALGGMFFDPILRLQGWPETPVDNASLSRAVGCVMVGMLSGLFVGLVEHFAKEAWLLMIAGPLAGKQFVVYKDPTVLGSSPKSDIYLFKDPSIEPRHAAIRKQGTRYEIEDFGTPTGTLVNGAPVERRALRDGDRITLGETVLEFQERARERAVAVR